MLRMVVIERVRLPLANFELERGRQPCHKTRVISANGAHVQQRPGNLIPMNNTIRETKTNWLWVAIVAVASVLLSMRLQCVLPFAALAAIGVLELRRAEALTLVGLAWAINQALGYGVLGYPHDFQSYAWGAVIGLASVTAVFAGEAMRDALAGRGYLLKAAAVLGMAYAAYEAVLFAATIALPATDYAFSTTVVVEYGIVNAVAFASLLAVHAALARTGLLGRRTTA